MPVSGEEVTLSSALVKFLWIPVITLLGKVFWDESRFTNLKKERDKLVIQYNERLTSAEKSLALLKATSITEQKVRDIFKEALEPFFSSQLETKEDIRTISENLTQLRIDVAGENASKGGIGGTPRS